MIQFYSAATLIVIAFTLAYFRAGLAFWTALAGLALAAFQIRAGVPPAAWAAFGAAALVLNLPPLRRALVMRPLLAVFKGKLPPLSRTEQEALEAGTVWWDGELFSGRPAWRKLLAQPAPVLTAEEQAFLDGPVEELCGMLDDWRIVEDLKDLPPEVWAFLKEKGFFGMIIPRQYGGLGFSALAHSQVIIKLAGRSAAAVVTVMVPNSLGPAELLNHYGTEEQKNHFLPRLARGIDLPCFALTSPEAGSDAASIPDTGVVCRGVFEGREVVGIRLNWDKRYITLGPVATLLGLAFRLTDPGHLLAEGSEGITLALIPTSTPGVVIGTRHDAMGIPFQVGPNWGRDVFIPTDWIIGGAAQAGRGWKMLMECLAAGRSLSLPALSTGGGKIVALVVGAYARVRKQFRLPIGKFEGIEEPLARIAANTYVMDAARTMTCGALDQGERPSVISAIVKYQCTERSRRLICDGMDVLGGSGICLGPRNLLGRAHQAIPISITVEGANILTRTLIIFGQGVIRCHPHVLNEMRSLRHPDALGEFDRHMGAHVAFTLSVATRSLVHGLTGGLLADAPGGPARRYYQRATRYSAAFAFASDIALLSLGGGLKRKEKLSGRCADILSNLYLISACLKQFEDRGRPAGEWPLLRWACEDGFQKIEEAFDGLFRNLPNRPAAWMLRWLTFPTGRHCAGPSDQLGHQLAEILLEPSAVRDRLTAGAFVPMDPREPVGRLEDALRKVIAAEPVEKKLWSAAAKGALAAGPDDAMLADGIKAGILTGPEGETLRRALEARREAIRVDDFPRIGQPKE
ncbi:acyl-CoA dehydrogenase [Geothrix sp. 21YS21S-2]|uniref:acyl-CoA dehydrogenase n=1 Tax=Geothrix sp. 21YS21S-2 TaxID=3068893 RepID=UPI0027BB0996|nr:acyl-CoA dehydrogenase [Geothrix sp. 21YS21S-2]